MIRRSETLTRADVEQAKPPGPASRGLIAVLTALHYAVLAWGLLGWLVPDEAWLWAYLIGAPLIAVQWLLNRNTCVLNNIEGWLRTGRWRNPEHAQEGGFIAHIVERALGIRLSPSAVNFLSYGLLGLFWMLALAHLWWRDTQ